MRTLALSLLGVAALTAGLILIRNTRPEHATHQELVPPGESVPGRIALERLRELGI
jgi:hypothetical protein